MNEQRLQQLQIVLKEMVDSSFVSGVNCMVIEHGEEQCYFEAGVANIETKAPIRRNSIFRLYSMSKPVTAAAVMLLIEEGKIDLLDNVSLYLPGFKNSDVETSTGIVNANREVNIHDLLSMTSGLVYGGDQSKAEKDTTAVFDDIIKNLYTDHAHTTVKIANRLGQCTLAYHPGEKWQYGTSADILGAIIEVVSGMKFGEFLKKRIFAPLKMVDTDFYVPESKKNRFTTVYMDSEEGLIPYLENNLGIMNDMSIEPAFESGGAGLVSTIDDYAKFAQMLMNKGTYDGIQYMAPKTVKFFTSAHLNSQQQQYMAGWPGLVGFTYGNLMRVLVDEGLTIFNGTVGEYGWDGWLGAYFVNDPKNDLIFLMMMQKKDTGTTSFTRKLRNVLASAIEL